MPAPRQGLVTDAHPVIAGKVREFSQVFGGPRRIVDRLGRNVGTQAQKPRAELVHQIELSRGAFEVARANWIGHGVKVAQRLKCDDLKAEVIGHPMGVARLAVEEGEVVLEDLNRAKPGLGGGGKLCFQRAAHAHGCDRPP